MKSIIKVFLFLLLSVFIFTTCDNSIGLGPKVNTEKPVIKTPDDADTKPGDFLQGDENLIWLDVQQEFGIAKVYMDVEYIDKKTGETIKTDIKNKDHPPIEAKYDEEKKQWFVNLDTTDMEDGNIKAWVTAVDVDGNSSTTTEIIYFIKNTPPQIKLNMPAVADDDFDNDNFLDDLADIDPLFLGFELLGLATDNYGIAQGYPKIMIWPAEYKDVDIDGIPKRDNDDPDENTNGGQYGTWWSMLPKEHRQGTTAKKFSWPMQKLVEDSSAPGGYRLPQGDEPHPNLIQGNYRIRIVTKDLFGNKNYYPNRTDNKRGPDGQSLNPADVQKKFMEIKYIASAIPISQVIDCTQYYNGANDFTCKFLVSCSNPLSTSTPVTAHITDGNDGDENEIGGPYILGSSHSISSPYNFTLTITPDDVKSWVNKKEGIMYLRLVAKDKDGKNGPPSYQYFQYDITPPKVPIERPVSLTNKREGNLTDKGGCYTVLYPDAEAPKWSTGTVTVGGRNDEANGIKDVLYHIGKLPIGTDDAAPAEYWTANYNNSNIWNDTKLNTSTPEPGWGGSVYSWTYTEAFSKGFKDNNPGVFQELSELYNYTGVEDSVTLGKERFYLPFYIKVIDYAGNFHIVHYKLCVDPDLDLPQVSISYPTPDLDVGGEVRLSGTANDNNWVHSVQVRIKKYGTGTGYDKNDENGKGTYKYIIPSGFFQLYSDNPDFPTFNNSTAASEKEGWFNAIKLSEDMMVGWYVNINIDGELNPENEDKSVPVRIEARSVDTKDMLFHAVPDLVGPTRVCDVKFNTGVPTIRTPTIQNDSDTVAKTYYEGVTSSRKFDIKTLIGDDQGITRLRVWINNIRYDLIMDGIPQNIPAAVAAGIKIDPIIEVIPGRVEGELTITIDTINNSIYKSRYDFGKTDYLNLEIEVQDDSTPVYTARNSYIIGVDNYFPTTSIETFRDALGNQFTLSGVAKDYDNSSGAIQDIARMLVYFEQATISYTGGREIIGNKNFLNPRGIAIGNTDSLYSKPEYSETGWTTIPLMTTNKNVREEGQGTGFPTTTFNNFPVLRLISKSSVGDVWESPHAMVIDNTEGTEDTDRDGTAGEFWSGLVDKTWRAYMDTTKFKDGPYLVHYIIMDKAGNATHYTRDIFIQNNKPVITEINIGTDVDGNGTVSDWTSETSPGEFRKNMTTIGTNHNGNVSYEPAFRIRGYNFRIMVNTTGGNNEKYGSITYVTVKTGPKLPATSMERGVVYTIATTGTTDWERYGAPPNSSGGTTFIATGPGAGTGTVTEYNLGKEGRFNFGSGVDNYNNIHFTGAPSFTGIPDSDKTGGVIQTHNQRLFILKVFDTVVASGNEKDMLAHAVLLAVDIDNSDDLAPKLDIAPFGQEYGLKSTGTNITWENHDAKELKNLGKDDYNKNIIMGGTDNSERQGYVQYAYNTDGTINAAGRADISGKVIFLGRAEDNQRIQNITVTIPGYNGGAGAGTAFTVASSPSGGGQLTSARPPASMETGNNAWYFNIIEQHLSLDYGHVINWEFGWDSSEVTNQVGTPAIIFTINDHKPTTPNTLPKTINVNIVPYISDVVTGLSGAYSPSSAFARSANGWYPVREDEVITIKGFNLGTATITGVTINGTALTYNANDTVASGNFRIVSKNEIKANVGTTATSGALSVRVGSTTDGNRTASINNTASIRKLLTGTDTAESNRVHYNWEPNGTNNNNLTNDRKLYIWNTGYVINDKEMLNPFMRMSTNSVRHVSLGRYNGTNGQGNLKLIIDNAGLSNTGNTLGTLLFANNDTGNGTVLYQTNRFINTTVGVGVASGTEAPIYAVMASNITSTQSNLQLVYNTIGAGDGNANGSTAQGAAAMKQRMRDFGSDPYRAQIPRVAVQRTAAMPNNGRSVPGRMVLSYYDAAVTSNPVIIHYGYNNGTNTNGTSPWTGNIPNANATAIPNTAGTIVADNSTTAKGGMYTAVGLLSTGRPVIAWYDSTNECLWFSYGPDPTNNIMPNTITNTDWQTNARKVAQGYGTHVDLAVDGSNNIHLAYVNASNGGLYYAFIPSAAVPTTGTITQTVFDATIRTARVDTFLSTGQKLMINIRENRPYISYIHNAFAESKNSIRVAWSKNTITAVGNVLDGTFGNFFTGNWEVMTVPAESIPSVSEFVCNGVPTSGNLTPPTGSTLGANYTTASNSIFITYMTNKWYEGAILKDTIPGKSNY